MSVAVFSSMLLASAPALSGETVRKFEFSPGDPMNRVWSLWEGSAWSFTREGRLACLEMGGKKTHSVKIPTEFYLKAFRYKVRFTENPGGGEFRGVVSVRGAGSYLFHVGEHRMRVTKDWKPLQELGVKPLQMGQGRWGAFAIEFTGEDELAFRHGGTDAFRVKVDARAGAGPLHQQSALMAGEVLGRIGIQVTGAKIEIDEVEIEGAPFPLYPREFEASPPVPTARNDPSALLSDQNKGRHIRPGRTPNRKAWKPSARPVSPFASVENLVADPGFEWTGEAVWRPIGPGKFQEAPPDQGMHARDTSVRRSGRAAMRLEKTQGRYVLRGNAARVDWQRPYLFAGWAKTDKATGKSYLEIAWYGGDGGGILARQSSHRHKDLLQTGPRHALMGVVRSEAVQGTLGWQRLAVRAEPPRGAWAAMFRLASEDNRGAVWFDDLECSVFGAPRVQIIVCQPGYQTQGHKSAVALCPERLEGATAFVAEAGKPRPRPVQGATIRHLGYYGWLGAHAHSIDFSDLRREGEYVLLLEDRAAEHHRGARAALRSGRLQSPPFPVRDGLYLSLVRLLGFYFYVARCGTEVPGWHKACHTDDANIWDRHPQNRGKVIGHRDLTGGWHDAGDYGYFHIRMWPNVWALATVQETLRTGWKQYGGDMPDLASEAAWGADYLRKAYRGDGLFLSNKQLGRAGDHDDAPSLITDGIPGTEDDRVAFGVSPGLPFPAAALAAASRAVGPHDAGRSRAYFELAREVYAETTRHWGPAAGWEDIYYLPNVLLADIELYRLHRALSRSSPAAERYAEDAETRIARILDLVEKKAYADPMYMGSFRMVKGSYCVIRYDFLVGPLLWLRHRPDTPHAERIRRVTRAFIEEFMLPRVDTNVSPFGQFGSYHDAEDWHMGRNYHTENYADAAYVLALAANVLDADAFLAPAERQIQWMLGRNPFGASYIAGTNTPVFAPWTGLINVPGHEDGVVPGSVNKGISWGAGTLDWGRRAPAPGGLGNPWGVPVCYVYPGGGCDFGNGVVIEIWQWFSGRTMMAALELHRALAKRKRRDKWAPLPLGSCNLVRNSGFEKLRGSAAENWDTDAEGADISWEAISTMPRHGQAALHIRRHERGEAAVLSETQVRAEPGDRFWLSFWAKGLGRVEAGLVPSRRGRPMWVADKAWVDPRLRRYDFELRPAAGFRGRMFVASQRRVRVRLRHVGREIWLDNVELRRLPPKETPWPDVVR